jgi:hypothetical protein
VNNGEHPAKPRTVYCRRAALRRWTGWADGMIDELEDAGTLKTIRLPHKSRKLKKIVVGHRYYSVAQVQKLLDEN